MTKLGTSSTADSGFSGTLEFAALSPLESQGFLVAAMYTPGYRAQASRLEASLRSLGLAHVLFEVPQVHRSISRLGGADPVFTKSAFIRYLLDRYQRPILYVDADIVFRTLPARIAEIVAAGKDFAIYNWLADPHTDAFKALRVNPSSPAGPIQTARYLGFSHSIDHYDPEQILCSGATQLYGNTSAARALLHAWAVVIDQQPGVADDHCLDCAFNNGLAGTPVSASWLGKDYARYAWWIYVKPVIDHPDPPASGKNFAPLAESLGRPRIHLDRLTIRKDAPLIPRNCIIDVERRLLCQAVSKDGSSGTIELVPVAPLEHELFLDPSKSPMIERTACHWRSGALEPG
jgi:hypothetical protein